MDSPEERISTARETTRNHSAPTVRRQESDELPVSVCITTKNNADTIGRCLESVSEWTDEIVVVDTESTDGTVEICESYGAMVYQHEFEGFAQIKTTAINHAENDWVFVLDADEEIPNALREEIFREFGAPGIVAFRMRKREHMLGARTHQYHFRRPYLARKDVLYYQQDFIWERLSVKDEFEGRTRDLSNSIEHYRFERTSEMERKIQQYSALEAIQIVESDKRDGALALLGRGLAVAASRLVVDKAVLDGYRGVFIAFMEFYQLAVAYPKIRDIYRLQEEHPENWREIWLEEECQR
ncbi:glycosyltransferase family 2 protein [Haloprofundus salilacus]|uniref:glycosyltransferase family 2 protein n=1 Tax=Haloprofundus salilacus TaxID=2876190 RepID=UPI001CCC1B99|nr:glycosyltransferase family 2 protein [Haloprofundus salilacus]